AEAHPLVAYHQDLRVLGRLATAQQDQPAEDPDCDQIQQTDRHRPRSCRSPPTLPNRSSQTTPEFWSSTGGAAGVAGEGQPGAAAQPPGDVRVGGDPHRAGPGEDRRPDGGAAV